MSGRRQFKAGALLLALLAHPALALDPDLAITQYTHRAWRAEPSEGSLPLNTVFSILQTRDGHLWMATQEGLARFDGVRFTVFNTRNTPEIHHNDVWTLLEDRDGSLWIGTRGGGLTRYKDGAFTNFSKEQGLSNDSVQALWQDRDGSLWVGTRGGGLNRYQDGKFKVFTTQDGLSSDTVYSLYGDRAGTLWIGTDGGGASLYKDGKFSKLTTQQGLSNDTVYTFREDRAGDLWIGTGAGLNRLHGTQIKSWRAADGLSNDNIRSLLEDKDGNLWIGTDGGGLNRMRNGAFTALTTKEGLSNDNIGALFEDREGSLWIGTDAGGLNRLSDNKFVSYTVREGLSNDNARAVIEDAGGTLWIGTFGGLNRYQDGRFTAFTTKDGLSSDVVLSLASGRNGVLWAGTLGAGLNRLHQGKFTHYSKSEGLSNDTVLGLLEDSAGTLWAGTRSGGLNKLESNGRFHAYTTADGLGSNDVRYILEARGGGLWLGTLGGGLNRFKDGKFTAWTKKDGLSSDLVLAVHEDAQGTVWAGTFGGGLNRFKNGKFTAYTSKDGLADDTVFEILEDDLKNLWLSSNRGVARITKKELDDFADGKVTTLHPVAYGVADGMKSAECNGAHQPAGFRARDGRLWFPTVQGLATVDPAHLPVNALAPPVVIESFEVNDHALAPGAAAELPPGRSKVDFRYAALSFVAPEKVQFKYKLEGYDEDWINPGTQRFARYTNLPPGQYTFHVIGSNNDGVWNETGASQAFTLKPYFWQRGAFKLVYVLGFGLAVALGMRLQRSRMRALQQRARELMQLVRERQRAEDALRGANEILEARVAELARAAAERAGTDPRLTEFTSPPPGVQNLEKLVTDFNGAMQQLAVREGELQQARDALAQEVTDKSRANAELENAVRRLKITQAQLVQSQKLASLGSLVAGVTSEIGGPVDLGVTAAAELQDRAARLQRQHALGQVSSEELDRFVTMAAESSSELLLNLRKALELVRSFRQVAVDQSSGERRRFLLKAYIEEVMLSLAPRMKRDGLRVTVQCPPGLSVDSFPGALAQVLGTLVDNSLMHAFPNFRRGNITITVHEEPRGVVLRYADDGAGIPAEYLDQIYDPFFTTRRGSGGTGLGLYVVYTLVTQRLGGTISASSTPGQGTFFDVRFPMEAPHTPVS